MSNTFGQRRPSGPRRLGLTANRRVCARALLDVEQGAFASLALDQRLQETPLSLQDRRFATDLFYGVVEKKLLLDYVLSRYMQRPMDDVIGRLSLRMGAYQILFMDSVPDFAACNQQVEMMRDFRRETLCSLVNGVLRTLSRQAASIEYPDEPLERLSVLSSTPKWLVERLVEQFGLEKTQAFLQTSGRGGGMYVRPNLLKYDDDRAFEAFLQAENIPFEPTGIPHIYHVRELRATHPAFQRGQFSILGRASALAALALAPKPGMQLLDACAAPGGKTCFLAELMQGSGRVHAFDLHEHRVRLISAYAKRLGLDNVRPRQADATQVVESLVETMDAVLVDAPCSGLGVLHEKPDLKYRLRPEDMDNLPKTQLAILTACARYPKPGGVLVYSTCTITSAENQDVVRAFLAQNPLYSLESLENILPEPFGGLGKEGMLTLEPSSDTEGFFIARLRKGKARP